MHALVHRLLIKTLWLIVVFLGITVISFWVIHLAPGKPTDAQTDLNPLITPEAIARLEKLYGLDQPIHVQYAIWLKKIAQFDFGNSLTGDRRPVWDKIKERLPLTIGMNLASLILTLALAIPSGSRPRPGRTACSTGPPRSSCSWASPCPASGWPCCSCWGSASAGRCCPCPA